MPELPEVETMIRGIRPHVVGKAILDVMPCKNNCRPITLTPSFRKFRDHQLGQQFSEVSRLGKRLVFHLTNQSHVVIEPRMTGLVLLSDPPDVEHLRFKWQFSGSGNYDAFWFWDRRGLGVIRWLAPGELMTRLNSETLGPDALQMSAEDWQIRCSTTKREIKVVLLDQKVVAGIGNLYASEILHVARINPSTAADTLKPRTLHRLHQAVQAVLSHAIECEGSTLGDGTYRNALNQNGSYQNQHRVYMKEGQQCPTCRKTPIEKIVQAQRSTFFCPKCQK